MSPAFTSLATLANAIATALTTEIYQLTGYTDNKYARFLNLYQ